uniref:Gamma-secretase subunit PEN-2 n=1 Tax=Kalanchoe fedtschenkoi TaxID=63787 RepID=A0A7N0VGC6_KALFE
MLIRRECDGTASFWTKRAFPEATHNHNAINGWIIRFDGFGVSRKGMERSEGNSGGSHPTIDGPLGLSEEEAIGYARRFFKFGFALLPWLWAVNCYYFWPVLRNSRSFPPIRPYVVRSAIAFTIFALVLSAWALTFAIGGERLFGSNWDKLVMKNIAEKTGLTVW